MTSSPVSSRPRVPVAVIDIGSNSGRVVVLQLDRAGHLRLLAGSRSPLRLVHDVDEKQSLSEESMGRAMEALRDFDAIARSAGAKRVVAVATAAMRDAANGGLFIERIRRELGIEIAIIGGKEEAHYGFLGAVRGLPVSSGLLFDLGGGSMQVSHFTRRALGRATSLPLGALRLSESFLGSDPPKPSDLRRLRDHVRKHLKRAHVSRLAVGEQLVGTGGTLRNLAKIDRNARHYPIGRLHGYVFPAERLRRLVARLASTRLKKRDTISGLSAERADSIVGGAVAIETLVEIVGASEIVVSGQGVREGVALNILGMAVSSPQEVREASIHSFTLRFQDWQPEPAERRRAVARQLLSGIEPRFDPRVAEALDHGARVLDVGRSVDFFDRHEHVADMLLATELNGFAHEEIALVAAVLRRAGDRHADPKRLSPLLRPSDHERLERAAVILALADDIEERCPRGVPITLACEVAREVKISVAELPAWRPRELAQRFEKAFGRPLVVRLGLGTVKSRR